MLTAKQIKFISSLHHKKFREEHGCFIAEGQKIVDEILTSDYRVQGIYATREWMENHIEVVDTVNIPFNETLPREMLRISALTNPGPVLAVVQIPDYSKKKIADPTSCTDSPGSSDNSESGPLNTVADRSANPLILALDDIRDPGNLGTIIRIADWFGINTILCSQSCVDVYNPKVVQATMGSIARVRIYVADLANALLHPHTVVPDIPSGLVPVFGAFLDGASIYSSEHIKGYGIIVIGNESHGISARLEPLIQYRIAIPVACPKGRNHAESLNAAVAAAIICSEFRRRTFDDK